ncbi:MAG TPA: cyclic nucleotide-binding domain-containing protein [Gaiellaceae bacterium]|nr:cyclic nucleotide-binding domain-containing protein [Gaiellaceae bacterium]
MVELALVESVPRFAALPSGTKAALADAFDEVTVPAGERIISQGEFAYELFAILEGTALVEQDGNVVATLGRGEVCGEIGLLLTGRRTAAIVADTPMRLLALFDQTFRRICREHPEFANLVHGESQGRFTRPANV